MKKVEYKIVLTASLIDTKNQLFYYHIKGDENWKETFINQKEKYISINSSGEIIYFAPWYFGKECNICENSFNNKLFFNINEHEKFASLCRTQNTDYWSELAKKTGDNNWLTRSIKI